MEDVYEVISQNEIMEILQIKRTTFFKLIKASALPVTKMGKKYYTTKKRLCEWIEQYEGREVFF